MRFKLYIFIVFITSLFSSCTFDVSGLGGYTPDITDNDDISDIDVPDDGDVSHDYEDVTDITDTVDATDITDTDGNDCTVNDTKCIDDFNFQMCNVTTGATKLTRCDYGCVSEPYEPHCYVFNPSNGVDPLLLDNPNLLPVVFDTDVIVNTDTGEIITTDSDVIRPAGNGLDLNSGILFEIHPVDTNNEAGLFVMTSLMVSAGVKVRVLGNRSIIIMADEVQIRGVIDVSAFHLNCSFDDMRCPGPGGWAGGSQSEWGQGPGGGQDGDQKWDTTPETGGGGAGYATQGGNNAGSKGDGGAVYGTPECVPLVGGSGGGGGGHYLIGSSNNDGRGGGGGGAIQISARSYMSFSVSNNTVSGIYANGAGGQANNSGANSGGGGGGSGGTILLEGSRIDIYTGVMIVANGGGGGAGRCSSDGSYGLISQEPAPGGHGGSCNNGGNGGAQNSPVPTDGSKSEGEDGTGGGGGSVGRIAVFGAVYFHNNGVFSPEPYTY